MLRCKIILFLFILWLASFVSFAQLTNADLSSCKCDTTGTSYFNLNNNQLNNLFPVGSPHAFGGGSELDLNNKSGSGNFPYYGRIFISFDYNLKTGNDALSYEFKPGFIKGQPYVVEFDYCASYYWTSTNLVIGISSLNNIFGTIVVTAPAPPIAWTHYAASFTSPENARYLTVASGGNDTSRYFGAAFSNLSITEYLPINLLSFSATANHANIAIEWSTGSEVNNDYFILLRAGNENVFMPIAKVYGTGNSSTTRNYKVVDSYPLQGVNYYRLRQVDDDGKAIDSAPASCFFRGLTKDSLNIFDRNNINVLDQELRKIK